MPATAEMMLNTLGLTCDIIGAILLFTHGPPPGILRKEVGISLIWDSGESEAEAEQRKIDKHIRIGRSAIGLIVFGFLLQLIASVLPS